MAIVKKFYNEKQKREFLEYDKANEKVFISYFHRISTGEFKYKKDISEMNEDELIDTLTALNLRREITRSHLLGLLRNYVDWAVLNGRVSSNSAINSIKPESFGSSHTITTQMIKDPEHLQHILDMSFKSGDFTLENRMRRDSLVFWLLYSGMKIDELQMLKKTDIDFENMLVKTIDGMNYSIDENIVELWKYCIEMTCIEKSGARSNMDFIEYKLADNDYLFRPIMGNRMYDRIRLSPNMFMDIISKALKGYFEATGIKLKLPSSNIRTSGIFYRILMHENDGFEITQATIAHFFGIEYSDNLDLSLKTRKWRIDYEDWKIAFGYA